MIETIGATKYYLRLILIQLHLRNIQDIIITPP